MRAAENPFRRSFWTGTLDARPLALLRIALGTIVLYDLLDRLRDFHAFYSERGIVPPPRLFGALRWEPSLFRLAGGELAGGIWFALGIAAALLFLLGWHTKVANFVTWLVLTSVQQRNIVVCDSSDSVLRLLLLWGLFADLSACYSLDRFLGRRPGRAEIPALPVRALQLQVAIVYVFSGLAKFGGTWVDGTAVERAMHVGDFVRPLGVWLGHFPLLCRLLSRFTLVMELAFPLLVFSPIANRRTRAIALLSGVVLHGGIFLTMRVGLFSEAMLISYLPFVAPQWLDALYARLRRRVPPIELVFDGRCNFCRASTEKVLALDLLERVVPLDAHRPETRERYPTLDLDRCREEMLAIDPRRGNAITGGFDAFRSLSWRLPALWWLAPLLYVPPAPQLGRVIYRYIAARRIRISGECALDAPPIVRAPALPPPAPARRWWRWLALAYLPVFAMIVWDQLDGHGWARPLPTPAGVFVRATSLWQSWGMFSPDPPFNDTRWEAPGELSDGTHVDAIPLAAPHFLPEPGFHYWRWYKYRSNLSGEQQGDLANFSRYVCRRYNSLTRGPRLQRFDLVATIVPHNLPGDAIRPVDRREIFHQSCVSDH